MQSHKAESLPRSLNPIPTKVGLSVRNQLPPLEVQIAPNDTDLPEVRLLKAILLRALADCAIDQSGSEQWHDNGYIRTAANWIRDGDLDNPGSPMSFPWILQHTLGCAAYYGKAIRDKLDSGDLKRWGVLCCRGMIDANGNIPSPAERARALNYRRVRKSKS